MTLLARFMDDFRWRLDNRIQENGDKITSKGETVIYKSDNFKSNGKIRK